MIAQYFQHDQFKRCHEHGTGFDQILKPYSDVNAPAFFMSTLSIEQISLRHKGPAVMIVNNDIRPIQNNLEWVKNKKDLYFISTSKLTSVYLDGLGLDYVEFPWYPHNIKDIKSYPKGSGIYFYGQRDNDNLYGYNIVPRLMKKHFPHIPVYYGTYHSTGAPFIKYTPQQLDEIYKKVFISIRLTRYDGLSHSAQTLGLRGIKSIWNGGTPSALSYKSEQDIINHIKNEQKTIGFNDTELSKQCKEYLEPTNPKYNYIFQLETYTQNKPTPKLFHNDQPLTFKNYNETIDELSNMNRPLSI